MKVYVTGFIPVLREKYQCSYDPKNAFKPSYKKVGETYLNEDSIFGILTNQELGEIPPLTIAKVEKDGFHYVDTFFFEAWRGSIIWAKDVKKRIERLRQL